MKIALAGNPNSGKTTMYNALTGSPMPAAVVSVEGKRYVQGSVNSKFRELPGEVRGSYMARRIKIQG